MSPRPVALLSWAFAAAETLAVMAPALPARAGCSVKFETDKFALRCTSGIITVKPRLPPNRRSVLM